MAEGLLPLRSLLPSVAFPTPGHLKALGEEARRARLKTRAEEVRDLLLEAARQGEESLTVSSLPQELFRLLREAGYKMSITADPRDTRVTISWKHAEAEEEVQDQVPPRPEPSVPHPHGPLGDPSVPCSRGICPLGEGHEGPCNPA